MTVKMLKTLKDIDQKMPEEEFLAGYDLYMTTILSNGEEIELLPGGKSIKINYSNLKQYVEKSFAARLSESNK
jgi:hypothetical protein